MWILTILAASLLTLLIFLLKRKIKDPGIPFYPKELPILGHLHMLLGDNVKLYDTIRKFSLYAIENGGCTGIKLGMFNYYMFTDPDDILAILNSTIEKNYMYSFASSWLGEGLLTAPPHLWQVKKKLLYPMFQQQNLNRFLTVFNNQAKRLVRQFSEHVGKGAFDHEPYALLISLETICQTALGSNVGEEMARNTEFLNAIEGLMNIIICRIKKVWLHFKPVYQISLLKKEHDNNLKIVNSLAMELINKRKSQIDNAPNVIQNDSEEINPFVDTIFKMSQENGDLNKRQILNDINTFIVGGYDTTANTIVFTLMLLGHHQDVQDKAYKEVHEVFGNTDRDVDKYDLPKLVYLEAVIKESLRFYPIFPFIARKLNVELKLKKYTIPAGTDCLISLYGLHRNAEWGKDAEDFNPDRWLNPETLPKNPNLFAPFGGGKRYCVGRTYAMISLKTTLAHVLRHYRVKSDLNKLVLQMMVLLKPASGQHIILESRTGQNSS